MTLLVGTPDIASTSQPPLSATLIYTRPYQREDRLGMGSVALTYDWALGEWQRDGEAFDLVAARFGQSDPAPPEIRISFTIGTGQTAQGTILTLLPIENGPGVLNIAKPLHVAQWVTGAAYESLQTQMQTAISNLNSFSTQGAAVAQSIADSLPLLDQKLADIEQSAAEALAVTGINPLYISETTADPPAAPDGTKGAKRDSSGGLVRLMRQAGAWVTAGAALLTLGGLPSIDVRTRDIRPTNTAAYNAAQFQALVDAAPDGSQIVGPPGVYPMGNKTIYVSNKAGLTLNLPGATFTFDGSRIGFLIHGGAFDRTLTGAAWSEQFLAIPYEGATYASDVVIRGLTTRNATASRTGTNVFFYFAKNCGVERLDIGGSDGGGVEFRQSVRCFARNFTINGASNYGAFFYQSYACVLEDFSFKNVGRAWEIKQRHKDYVTLAHRIRRGRVEDATGFPAPLALQTGTPATPNPGWITSAVSYNDQVRYGGSAAAQTHRNFPGHEISLDVEIEDVTFALTADAHSSLGAPSLHLGCYARGWVMRRIICEGGGRASVTPGLMAGSVGDYQFGGVFGGDNVVEDSRWTGYDNRSVAEPFVSYGTGLTLRRCYFNGAMRLVVAQTAPAATYVPGGTVDKVVMEDCSGDVDLALTAVGEGGIRIRLETQLFVSRRNRWSFKPVNDPLGATATASPYYISAQKVNMEGDEYTVPLNAAATNHTTTFGYLTSNAGLAREIRTTFSAPVSVRGMVALPGGGNLLVIDGGRHVLGNTPSGEKVGLRLENDVDLRKLPELGGGATLVDMTNGRNASANPNRVTYGTAAPTTGTWSVGDRRINSAPTLGAVSEWRCTVAGAPGTWTAIGTVGSASTTPPITYGTAAPTTGAHVVGEIVFRNGFYDLGGNIGWVCRTGGTPGTWEMFGQTGNRVISVAPTFDALFIGEELLDSAAKKWYKAVSVGTGATDWVALN